MFTGLSTLRKTEKKTVEQTAEAKKLQEYLQKYSSGEVEGCNLDAVRVSLEEYWSTFCQFCGSPMCHHASRDNRRAREEEAEKEESSCS